MNNYNCAYSLHIGVNEVDPKQYHDWDGKLNCCEADAKAMYKIATDLKYASSELLLTEAATIDAFYEKVNLIRQKLKAGDLFWISFSGHGGQVPDRNFDEQDGLDETLCFYDDQLLDDDIHELLKTFEKGVRILITCDSCHSGDVLRNIQIENLEYGRQNTRLELEGVVAAVRLISSSQEDQLSREKYGYGLFTYELINTWDDGKFQGNYQEFYEAIVCKIPDYQIPNHWVAGPVDPEYDECKPFIIPLYNPS